MNNIKSRKSNNRRSNGFSRNSGSLRPRQRQNNNGKKKAVSSIDPNTLIKKAIPSQQVVFTPSRSFDQMPIHAKLKANILRKGFSNPTQIQDETLEHLTAGRDLLGVANTGTGKTAAFFIPIIDRLLQSPNRFTTLVVVPTHQLDLKQFLPAFY